MEVKKAFSLFGGILCKKKVALTHYQEAELQHKIAPVSPLQPGSSVPSLAFSGKTRASNMKGGVSHPPDITSFLILIRNLLFKFPTSKSHLLIFAVRRNKSKGRLFSHKKEGLQKISAFKKFYTPQTFEPFPNSSNHQAHLFVTWPYWKASIL